MILLLIDNSIKSALWVDKHKEIGLRHVVMRLVICQLFMKDNTVKVEKDDKHFPNFHERSQTTKAGRRKWKSELLRYCRLFRCQSWFGSGRWKREIIIHTSHWQLFQRFTPIAADNHPQSEETMNLPYHSTVFRTLQTHCTSNTKAAISFDVIVKKWVLFHRI